MQVQRYHKEKAVASCKEACEMKYVGKVLYGAFIVVSWVTFKAEWRTIQLQYLYAKATA